MIPLAPIEGHNPALSNEEGNGLDLSGAAVPLKVVIVYESPTSARRAYQMVSRVASISEDSIQLQPTLWRIDLLKFDSISCAASADAVSADLLVIATDQSDALPKEATRWLDECFADPAWRRPATVTLFGTSDCYSLQLN